jgi:uroporphyrinogen decarboxylase
MGVDVRFVEGEGPRVELTTTAERIEKLDLTQITAKLAPVAETVRRVKKDLPEGAALIGFAGAPWTVACYMLQGKSGKEFEAARLFALKEPMLMQQLMDRLVTATAEYLSMQVEAGAEALQIFDSWAGLLTPAEFAKWSTAPTVKLVKILKEKHPHIPLIGFAKGAGLNLADYAKQTNVNCIGVDQNTPMEFAIAQRAHAQQAVQGNLDPLLIASSKDGAVAATEAILSQMKGTPSVFNLGHGFIPSTPIENVMAVAEKVKSWRR